MSKKDAYNKFVEQFELSGNISLEGCKDTAGSILLSHIARKSFAILVTATEDRAFELESQIKAWLPFEQKHVFCMPQLKKTIYDQTAVSEEKVIQRIAAISKSKQQSGLIIVPAAVLIERFHHVNKWVDSCFEISLDSYPNRETLIKRLCAIGYKRVAVVEQCGTFSVRGSLIDVFSPNLENPVRFDFFGDGLESIKEFSVDSQRSFDTAEKVMLVPARECIFNDKETADIARCVNEQIDILSSTQSEILARKLEHFISKPDCIDYKELKPFVAKGTNFVIDFWENATVILENGEEIFNRLNEQHEYISQKFLQLNDIVALYTPVFYYHRPEKVIECIKDRNYITLSRFGKPSQKPLVNLEQIELFSDVSKESFLNDIGKLLKNRWSVVLVIADKNRYNNIKGLLAERKIKLAGQSSLFSYGSVSIINGVARRGFKCHETKLAVFSEEDIYSVPAKDTGKRRVSSKKRLADLEQMVAGDMVVHEDHGLAEFRGIKIMTAGGNTREYLLLQYAGTDKLYVPTDQAHKVTTYIGMEGFSPKIHSLNSKTWSTQKKRVSKNIEAIAKELVSLYAKRLTCSGFAFETDRELQIQMENLFPFTETPDQQAAIDAVKQDMESEMPMDRLVCGDVGYGKTEVAMRAAFKAVCSNKQVAILAPTTLLALQHYETITNRFKGFAITVEMVSRLKKPSQQRETIKKAKAGTLDILIGTHRLLSKDVEFKNLGLLIVDEEQRFGVKHKEKLKQLKSTIDVLTLTATPIPRTMQMALSGIRQISIIDTPPPDRRPVETYVAPMDATWVKRSIINELKRGGQIYYVYNRVEKIEQKALLLKKLIPEARIVVAHGQQPETEIEKTMLDFVNKKYDLLLSTTIIESGLDIPNVNTLIVDEAERLGLSQMYQLRGRVGRSSRQAWAYFFYSRHKRLTKEATERLETIEEHTALGSGFKIAMRDMQIRGAGNMLGETQSGQIASLGLSLYMQLLEEAVEKHKPGGSKKINADIAVEIPVTAYFPESYICEQETRVQMYSKLSRCSSFDLLSILKEECLDRFGPLPKESEGLFKIIRLRILAAKAGVKKISKVINCLRFEFLKDSQPDVSFLLNSQNPFVQDILLDPKQDNAISLDSNGLTSSKIFNKAEQFLELIAEHLKERTS